MSHWGWPGLALLARSDLLPWLWIGDYQYDTYTAQLFAEGVDPNQPLAHIGYMFGTEPNFPYGLPCEPDHPPGVG